MLAFGQGLGAESGGFAGTRASVDVVAEASQLALGGCAVSERSAGVELVGGVLQFVLRALGLTGLRERAPGERPRESGLDRGACLVGGER